MYGKLITSFFVLVSTVFISTVSSFAQQRLAIGDKHMFYSNILEQDREILVGLPRDYTEEKKYPVLYLLDGGRYYMMAQGVLDFLNNRAGEIPQVILVAIPNIYRNTDLTPVFQTDDPDARTIEFSGGAEKFLEFFKRELRPFIINNYSTSGNNILFGHSMAGLFASFSFLEEPGLFDNYIISDPSLWYGDNMMIKKLTANMTTYFGIQKSVYMTQIDRSNDEEDIMSEPQSQFVTLLDRLPGVNVSMVLIPDENHSTVPLKTLYKGMTYIFKNEGDD